MRTLFRDLRFRRALSLAINRAEINDIVYYGRGPRTARHRLSRVPGTVAQDLRLPRRQPVHDRHGRHGAPTLYIAKNNIGNVPTAYPPPRSWAGDLTAYADQLFFKQ